MTTKNFVVKNGITTGNIVLDAATGNITATNANLGNLVIANFFSGNANALFNIQGANVVGTVNNAAYAGNITVAAQPNITSVGTLTSISVSGNANIGNIGTGGVVTATGNITGGNLVTSGTANVGNLSIQSGGTITGDLIPSTNYGGNLGNATNLWQDLWLAGNTIYLGNQTVSSNANGVVLSNSTFLTKLTVSGNANIGNLGTSGLITATGNIAGANLVTGGVLSVTGNANIGNIGTGIITATGTATAGNLATAGTLSAGGNANIGNIGTGIITATGTVTAGNLTTGGTLSATGNANVGNLGTTALVATGSGSFGANVNMNNKWVNNVGYPVLTTDAATKEYVDTMASTGIAYHQPVAVATTTTLATATGGTVSYNNGTDGVGANLTTTGTFLLIDGANVQTAGTRILVKNEANAAWNGVYEYTSTTVITRTSDADEYGPDSATQLSVNDYFFVQGGTVNEGIAYIVSAPSGTITFGTSNITFAQFSTSQVYDAGTGLTLTNTTFSVNPSQTQVTSVGTLTSLSVSGNANIGNIGTTGVVNTGTLTVSGVTNLGSVSNVKITGGSSGQIIQTDGSGNLSFATISTSGVSNGTSSVTIPTVNGNINLTSAGNTTMVVTGTGANITGTANVSGNLDAGNIGTSGLITATGNITGGNITTGGVVSSTGNVTGGNITTGGVVTATGNITGGNLVTGGALSVTGNANVGNIGATYISGTLTTNAQPNITSTGVLTELIVANTILADGFRGRAGGDISLASGGANGNVVLAPDGTGITNLSGKPLGNVSTISATGNANVGNIGTGGLITATGNIGGGNINTGGLISATGNANVGNVNTTGVYATILSGTGNANIGNIGTGIITASGNITGANIITGGIVSATGNGTFGNVAGGNLVSANYVTGTLTTGAQPNITSVGTITSLSISGNATVGNVLVNGGLQSNRTNVSVTTNTVIDQFAPADIRTAKYIISASSANGYQSVEALLVQDGTNSYITIYGSVCSNAVADIIDISSNINGVSGNVALYATSSGGTATVNLLTTYLKT